MDERDKERILNLTIHIVEGMVERGEVDVNDEAALKRAGVEAAKRARAAYFAALEYVSG